MKLDRSVRAAEELGAQTVVVHPPFRWQRRYAEGFSDEVAALEASSDVVVAVENMFPFRADRFFGPASHENACASAVVVAQVRRFRLSRRPMTRWTAITRITHWTFRTPRQPEPTR
ncbi:family 2 AP endonuclease [Mycobacterium ulcerans str. Harvey]|uniref:Family 2 AP endonuclease n=1 Tax=Mycobacterium ulcerans str. Harvey TaxID=1299332 RepID=A0ABP3A3J3_MYCUL|nr:family 2 AP endonuclease [Mycobacterium ulcerans str. Harvey]